MESKGLRVNMAKTKIKESNQPKAGLTEETGKYPCGLCQKGVDANSILYKRCYFKTLNFFLYFTAFKTFLQT